MRKVGSEQLKASRLSLPLNLVDLDDVDASAIADGKLLVYRSVSGKHEYESVAQKMTFGHMYRSNFSAGLTRYWAFHYISAQASEVLANGSPMPAGYFTGMRIYSYSNTMDGSTYFNLRDDTADITPAIAFTAGLTGTRSDYTKSSLVALNSKCCLKGVSTASTVGTIYFFFSIDFEYA